MISGKECLIDTAVSLIDLTGAPHRNIKEEGAQGYGVARCEIDFLLSLCRYQVPTPSFISVSRCESFVTIEHNDILKYTLHHF